MALPEQRHAGFTTKIKLHIFMDDCAYIPEPPLETECKKVWYHYAFIPYVFASKVHAFMGPLPKYIKKPQLLQDYFPIYRRDESFKFNFFKNRVFYSSPPLEDVEYIKFLGKVVRRKARYWKD